MTEIPEEAWKGPKSPFDAPEDLPENESRGWAIGYNQAVIDGRGPSQSIIDRMMNRYPENKNWARVRDGAETIAICAAATLVVAVLFLIWSETWTSYIYFRVILSALAVGMAAWAARMFAEART